MSCSVHTTGLPSCRRSIERGLSMELTQWRCMTSAARTSGCWRRSRPFSVSEKCVFDKIGAIGIALDVPNYSLCLCLDGVHVVGRRDSFNRIIVRALVDDQEL